MKTFKTILTIVFGVFMIVVGLLHFINPERYFPFIPDFLSKPLINFLTGLIELLLGIGVFIPQYKSLATMGILVLMLVFLPLHVIDVFKESPAIGTHQMAVIRMPLQFILIWWAWFINKK